MLSPVCLSAQVGVFVAWLYHQGGQEVYFVLSDVKQQDSTSAHAALTLILQHFTEQHGDTPCIIVWSDGCSGQFKGSKAFMLHRRLAIEQGAALEWNYTPSGHGKGPHDGAGGRLKHALFNAMQRPDQPIMSTAAALAEYASAHLATPAGLYEPSEKHRERAVVQQHTYLVMTQADNDNVATSYQQSELESALLITSLPTGIRKWHHTKFAADRGAWHAQWAETACGCAACMGSQGGPCLNQGMRPPTHELQLFQGSQEEWEMWQLLRGAAMLSEHERVVERGRVTVPMLVRYLKVVGLPKSGSKAELMERAKEALLAERQAAVIAAPATRGLGKRQVQQRNILDL